MASQTWRSLALPPACRALSMSRWGWAAAGLAAMVSIALPTAQNSALPTLLTVFVNADTIPDILVSDYASGKVAVFLGNGSGGFVEKPLVTVNTAPG